MPFDRSVSPFSFAPILAATLCMAAAQIATADGTRVSDTEPPAQAMREDLRQWQGEQMRRDDVTAVIFKPV